VRETMKRILADIQSGKFAKEWMDENTQGRKRFLEMRAKASDQLIEKVGMELRKMMAWNRPAEEATAAQAQARFGSGNTNGVIQVIAAPPPP